jgi:hypothetical protein
MFHSWEWAVALSDTSLHFYSQETEIFPPIPRMMAVPYLPYPRIPTLYL